MKLKVLAMCIILLIALVTSGCGGASSEPAATESGQAGQPPASSEKTDEQSSGKLNTISDFSEAWNSAYNQNEAAINNYEGVIMELATPGLEFISGIQFDLLNMENKNGHFEGELMMAGWPGVMEKDGAKIKFGYDTIREEDGFSPSMKAGDRLVEDGKCDLSKGTYQTESFTERNGEKVNRSYSEFKQLKNGDMICLMTTSYSINAMQEAVLSNTCIYIKAGKDKFDFVIGIATQGPAFEKLLMLDKDDLAKDEARQMMEAAGYQIRDSGYVENGTLIVE
ncbi:MAG: hypothetical protein GX808_00940 [Syntrophomonadaceae bacterium]|jgi:hypothetical protein|nr:hypothetical protein [Syntrophomonadaceae bacterium]